MNRPLAFLAAALAALGLVLGACVVDLPAPVGKACDSTHPCPEPLKCLEQVCSPCTDSAPTLCGETCTDTDLDKLNCGQCGNACPGGSTCQAGKCSGADVDGGMPDASQPTDASAGALDAGVEDAGAADIGSPDAGSADIGSPDAGAADVGTADAGTPDVGHPDVGAADTGGTPDIGVPDVGTPDTGPAVTCIAPAGQVGSGYDLTFRDEFEAGALDMAVWNDHIWYETSDPTINYATRTGALKIWPAAGFVARDIDTDGRFEQKYGFFEAEAKLPIGKGLKPIFWLLAHVDATRPEIDVLSAYPGGGASSGWSDASFHPLAFGNAVWLDGATSNQAGDHMEETGLDLSAGFHKYGMKWEATKVTFYFDGNEVYTVNATLTQPMYLLLSLHFGEASGTPDGTTPTGESNSFEISYVRAWRFADVGCPP